MFFNDESDAPTIRMNGRQKLFICMIDLGIITELCIAMSAAQSAPDAFTPTFMRTFFSLFIPTLIIGLVGFRKLRARTESAGS